MIDPTNITHVVRKTLNRIGIHEPATETLIKGTFLAESNLGKLFDLADNRHGLMLMRKKDIEWTFNEYIRHKHHLVSMLLELSGYDVFHTDTSTLINEINSNIALQVLVLYAWYDSKGMDIVEDDLEKLGVFWRKNYSHNREGDVDDFIERYKEVFVN
jgi:hypothetical protein